MRLFNILFEFAGEREKRWAREYEPQRINQWKKGSRQKEWEREFAAKDEQKAINKKKKYYAARYAVDNVLKFAKQNQQLIPAIMDMISGVKNSVQHFENQSFKNFLLLLEDNGWWWGDPNNPEKMVPKEKLNQKNLKREPQKTNIDTSKLEQIQQYIKQIPRSQKLKVLKTLKNWVNNPPEPEEQRIILPK